MAGVDPAVGVGGRTGPYLDPGPRLPPVRHGAAPVAVVLRPGPHHVLVGTLDGDDGGLGAWRGGVQPNRVKTNQSSSLRRPRFLKHNAEVSRPLTCFLAFRFGQRTEENEEKQ